MWTSEPDYMITLNHKCPPHGGARGKLWINPLGTICATFYHNPLNSCKDICLDRTSEPINQMTDMSNPGAAEENQKYRWKTPNDGFQALLRFQSVWCIVDTGLRINHFLHLHLVIHQNMTSCLELYNDKKVRLRNYITVTLHSWQLKPTVGLLRKGTDCFMVSKLSERNMEPSESTQ